MLAAWKKRRKRSESEQEPDSPPKEVAKATFQVQLDHDTSDVEDFEISNFRDARRASLNSIDENILLDEVFTCSLCHFSCSWQAVGEDSESKLRLLSMCLAQKDSCLAHDISQT